MPVTQMCVCPKCLWPKCVFGRNVCGQNMYSVQMSVAKTCVWPKCFWPKCVFSQMVWGPNVWGPKILAEKSLAQLRMCHSRQNHEASSEQCGPWFVHILGYANSWFQSYSLYFFSQLNLGTTEISKYKPICAPQKWKYVSEFVGDFLKLLGYTKPWIEINSMS